MRVSCAGIQDHQDGFTEVVFPSATQHQHWKQGSCLSVTVCGSLLCLLGESEPIGSLISRSLHSMFSAWVLPAPWGAQLIPNSRWEKIFLSEPFPEEQYSPAHRSYPLSISTRQAKWIKFILVRNSVLDYKTGSTVGVLWCSAGGLQGRQAGAVRSLCSFTVCRERRPSRTHPAQPQAGWAAVETLLSSLTIWGDSRELKWDM